MSIPQRDSTGASYYTGTATIFTDFEDLVDVEPQLNIQSIAAADAYIKMEPYSAGGVFMTVSPITNVMNNVSLAGAADHNYCLPPHK